MTTTKSFSKTAPLFRVALKNQLPFVIVTTIGLLLLYPLVSLMQVGEQVQWMRVADTPLEDMAQSLGYIYQNGIYTDSQNCLYILMLLALLTVASVLVGGIYLQRRRMVDLFHGLPVKRSTLLRVNLLASYVAVAGPMLVIYVLTVLAHVITYGRYGCFTAAFAAFTISDIFQLLVYIAVICVLTGFVIVHVGTAFDGLIITGALGFLPTLVTGFLYAVWQDLIYGASAGIRQSALFYLSPFLFPTLRHEWLFYSDTVISTWQVVLTALIWLAIAAALFALTTWCYNRRPSEMAEQSRPAGLFQIIAKCLAGLCGGMVLFFVFHNYSYPLAVRLLALLLGAVFVGIVAEVVLSRSVRHIPRNLKWLLGSSVLYCALVLVINADIPGYVHYVPQPGDVQSVTISYRGRFETQSERMSMNRRYYGSHVSYSSSDVDTTLILPESIQVVLNAHTAAVANPLSDYEMRSQPVGTSYHYFTLQYKLKNGKTVSRRYYNASEESYRTLVELEDKEDFIRENHGIFFTENQPGPAQADLISYITVRDGFSLNAPVVYMPDKEELNQLLDAVRYDMLSEAFGDIVQPSQPAAGYIEFQFRDRFQLPEAEETPERYTMGSNLVLVPPTYTETLRALDQMGLGDVMKADSSTVDQVYILPMDRVYYQIENHTQTLDPLGRQGYRYSDSGIEEIVDAYRRGDENYLRDVYYSDDAPILINEVEDPAHIAAIAEASKSQLYAPLTREEINTGYVVAVFVAGGKVASYKFVPAEAVPGYAKDNILQYFREQSGAEQEGHTVVREDVMAVAVYDTSPRF